MPKPRNRWQYCRYLGQELISRDSDKFVRYYCLLKGSEFLRKVYDLGKRAGMEVSFVPQRGKGSHGTLYYGDRFTIVRNPKDELKKGTLHEMLKQLGIDKENF